MKDWNGQDHPMHRMKKVASDMNIGKELYSMISLILSANNLLTPVRMQKRQSQQHTVCIEQLDDVCNWLSIIMGKEAVEVYCQGNEVNMRG